MTARRERPTRRWISCVRPDCLPCSRLAPHALMGGAGQHAIFGRHPALAGALEEGRRAFFQAGGDQHMGVAELDQAGAFGMVGNARFEASRGAFRRPRVCCGAWVSIS